MKFVLAATTYNRLHYLKPMIESWEKTKSKNIDWILIIADDGSKDGTLEYIKNIGCDHIILGNRRGMMYQTNQILKYCENISFDIGFKVDDDILFKKQGWDLAYAEAIEFSKFEHLCFHDVRWERKKRFRETISPNKHLECKAFLDDTQGAFWTFTNKIIKEIGFMDIYTFGMYGFGHRDYTFRCCRGKFNEIENIFDLANSNQFIELNLNNYNTSSDLNLMRELWSNEFYSNKKNKALNDPSRIFVGYKERAINIYKNPLFKIY